MPLLIDAATNNDVEEVARLLSNNEIDVNEKNPIGSATALYRACVRNFPKIVALLASHPKIDPNALFSYYEITALGYAAFSGHIDCVRALLVAPTLEVNKPSSNGNVPLVSAYIYKKTDVITLLLGHPDLDPRTIPSDQVDAQKEYKEIMMKTGNLYVQDLKQWGFFPWEKPELRGFSLFKAHQQIRLLINQSYDLVNIKTLRTMIEYARIVDEYLKPEERVVLTNPYFKRAAFQLEFHDAVYYIIHELHTCKGYPMLAIQFVNRILEYLAYSNELLLNQIAERFELPHDWANVSAESSESIAISTL